MTEQTAQFPSPVVSPPQALEFLESTATLLAGSLNYDKTLRDVAQLTVPDIADWCAVYVTADDGSRREITSEHPDPAIEATLLDIRERRRAERGQSETLQVLETGKSILASDVRGSYSGDVTVEQRAALERLSARSYMLVPLIARGRVIGSMTLLSTRAGRHYTAEDLRFAETLAVRFALAIDNARLYDSAERSLALLDTLFASAPVGFAFVDSERRYQRVNGALAALEGSSPEDLLGSPVDEAAGALAAQIAAGHRQVMESGEALLGQDGSGGVAGELRHWVASFTPVRAVDDHLLGVSATVIDVTERRALLEAEREARLRADFLAQAGAILDSSLDYEETLANVAQIAVPAVADWCGVSILDDSGALNQVAAAHVDPAKRAIGEELTERFPPDPGDEGGAVGVARTGVTEFVPDVTDEMLVAGLPDPEQLRLVRALGLRSIVIAPLRARDRIFGALTLATAESATRFDEADVQLAEELARRAGSAIDNARLYTERTRIAHTLQARLLPERLPDIPGAAVAARYRAAGELNEVGGDFYDVFARGEDDWALVVGDVSGKGAEAAAVTALARYTLRIAALDDGPPSQALERLNDAMLAGDTSQFATVVLAYAQPCGEGCMRVRLALGGHPPPLVMRADGSVDAPGEFGSLLGAHLGPTLVDTEITLRPGDAMLLYTDGVTEAGARTAPFGADGLVNALRGMTGAAPHAIVDVVERAVVDAQEGEPRDDIALLALAVPRLEAADPPPAP